MSNYLTIAMFSSGEVGLDVIDNGHRGELCGLTGSFKAST